ncbi:unnamed protein product [Withania somnifera]
MEVASKRRSKISRNGVVVAGSVCENRTRFDEFKGGMNVYSEKQETPQVENDEKISTSTITSGVKTHQAQEVDKNLDIIIGSKTNLDVVGKRKTWKRSELGKSLDEKCKELSGVGAMKKSPIQSKRFGLLLSDGNEKMCELKKVKNVSPNYGSFRKMKLEMESKVVDKSKKSLERVFDESSNGNEGNGIVNMEKCEEINENSKKFDVVEENEVVVDVLDEKRKNLEREFGESSDGNEGIGIQLRKVKSEKCEEVDENSKKSNVVEENQVVVDVLDVSKKDLERVFSESSDGNEKNGIVNIEKCEEVDGSFKNFDVIEENEVVVDVETKVVDETKKNLERVFGETSDGNEMNRIQLRKVKSDKGEELDENSKSNVVEENKVVDVLDESNKNIERVFIDQSRDGNEANRMQLRKVKSEANKVENEKSCDLRKVKSLCLNGNLRNSIESGQPRTLKFEQKCKKEFEENKVVVVADDVVLDESKKNHERSSNNMEPQEKLNLEIKTKKIVIVEENKVHISNNEKKPMSISQIIKKESPTISGQSRTHHHSTPSRTKPVPTSDESQSNIPRQHSKLETFVDLIMWRDTSKSALIFGVGTFFIISSSYTQDLNISFISVMSYLGLIYLATIFLFRSLRGANVIGEYVLGEEEALWVLKLILPYINECLMKIRALFSGDPATTMKMAVLLFILARCGSSVTIWKMSKLVFGVFIIPKVFSSYSTQLTAYGTFWIRRFRDAWISCTHKKAVAFAIFILIWNLSSISARIWTVFMLYVGFRYYQEKMMKEGWVSEEEITYSEDYWQGKIGGQRQIRRKSNLMESKKKKKTF